jgi:hypothetical protein
LCGKPITVLSVTGEFAVGKYAVASDEVGFIEEGTIEAGFIQVGSIEALDFKSDLLCGFVMGWYVGV